MVSLYITSKNLEEAKKISEAIMAAKAAGCINTFPTQSIWRDDETGEVVEHEEVVLIIKTLEKMIAVVEEIVLKVGSYKTPCVAAFQVDRINREYKEWLGRVVA